MTKKLLFVTTILLALAVAAMAADVSGKWVYEQPGRGGGDPVKVTITLKADGGKVTGNVARPGRGGDMMTMNITEGTVNGNDVSFKTTMEMNGNTMTNSYTGTVSGDEMKLKVDNGRGPRDFTAKRSGT